MTGILPVLGVGARISGSTPVGGQSTPSDLASLSPSGSARGSLAVVPCGATVPCCGIDCVGAHLDRVAAFMVGAVDQDPDFGFPHVSKCDFLRAGKFGHPGIEARDMAQGKPRLTQRRPLSHSEADLAR